ncbi:hypothetical protein SAMN06265349_101700 [Flavobacterium resistens]|uniref:Uncharacterized protein n=1 Tax=Flavobacterium resistens TaxID=443612 RepID=A0A521B5F8_9FLAO|nr:hypothetical protein [Flavobacterium resistens]MRX70296.1 hypothetical protein [Flavobacterium resistens]SMO42337.1 hypothetical protein SAMN06265349_101700 [Flavobacterium resistens]
MKLTIKKETPEDYLMSHLEICKSKEDLILAFWMYWVDSVVTNAVEFQKVLSSSAVNKWFLLELRKQELIFKMTISEDPEIKGRDRDWLYCKCIAKLMSRFPKSLVDFAKKREQKEQPIKINGRKILIPIEQQN